MIEKARVRMPEPIAERELERYVRVLIERRWLVLGALVLGMIAFSVWAMRQPRIYQASASILVEATPPQIFGAEVRDVEQVGPGQYYAMQDYLQTQKRVITSDTLARRTVQRLHLLDETTFWDGPAPKTLDEAAERFVGSLTAESIMDTQILVLSYRHTLVEQAKRAVDGLADAYIEANLEHRDRSNESASHWLADEADTMRAKLGDSEVALYEFKHKNELLSVSLEDRINNVTREIDKYSDALTNARLQRLQRTSEAEQLSVHDEAGPVAIGSLEGIDPVGLKHELAEDERRLSELRARYQDAHPLVQQQLAKVAASRAALHAEATSQVRAAQARAAASGSEEKKIAAQLESAKQEGLRITRLEVEYNKLKRESDALAKQYQMVQGRTKEAELATKVKANNLHVLDYARVPHVPISPHLTRSGIVAMLMSLLAGMLLAFAADALDRTVKKQSDIEVKLDLPFLGIVPHVIATNGDNLDRFVADNPQSAVAECMRLIRTNLQFADLARPLRRVLITSSNAREGKTFTAVNLGLVLGQAGQRVLIVDADLRRPRLRAALGLDTQLGLTSVLLGTATLDEAIQPTPYPNVFALLSGPVPPNPAELVDGPAFRRVLDECSSRFERVLLDSPPAVPVTDPAILSTYCDGVVLVVRSGRTGLEQAKHARQNILSVGGNLLGAVLNDADLSAGSYGAGAYSYGYYRQDPPDAAPVTPIDRARRKTSS